MNQEAETLSAEWNRQFNEAFGWVAQNAPQGVYEVLIRGITDLTTNHRKAERYRAALKQIKRLNGFKGIEAYDIARQALEEPPSQCVCGNGSSAVFKSKDCPVHGHRTPTRQVEEPPSQEGD